VKYGALKQEGGRLEIVWRLEPDAPGGPRLVPDWRESGCVMPAEPPGRGYGRQLIERALAMTLGTKADLAFGSDGVTCRIAIPLGPRPARAHSSKARSTAPPRQTVRAARPPWCARAVHGQNAYLRSHRAYEEALESHAGG
jgi:two-component system CheB/CheR fusion protein